MEDAIKAFQRPKIERYGDMIFAVLRTTRYVEHTELTESSEVVETGSVMLFIGDYVSASNVGATIDEACAVARAVEHQAAIAWLLRR